MVLTGTRRRFTEIPLLSKRLLRLFGVTWVPFFFFSSKAVGREAGCIYLMFNIQTLLLEGTGN